MQINISNLSEGIHVYNLSESADKIGLESDFRGPVTSHVTLEKSMDQLLLTVDASVKGVFVCDRCSDQFEEEIKTTFTTLYVWERDKTMEKGDDFYILRPDENIIDISGNVREYLMLAVPVKKLCKKSECEIPQYKTEEENSVDPRWEKLKELIRK